MAGTCPPPGWKSYRGAGARDHLVPSVMPPLAPVPVLLDQFQKSQPLITCCCCCIFFFFFFCFFRAAPGAGGDLGWGCLVLQPSDQIPWGGGGMHLTLQKSIIDSYTHIFMYLIAYLKSTYWSSRCGTAEMNPTSNHEDMSPIPGLVHWVKDLVLPWAAV